MMTRSVRMLLLLMLLAAAAGWLLTLQTPASAQEPTPLPTLRPAAPGLTIVGTVENGTPDAPPPAGAPVLLEIYRQFSRVETRATTLAPDGGFRFTLDDPVDGDAYLVRVNHAASTFSSDIGVPSPAGQPLDLSLTVFEPTTSPAAITVEQLHISAQRRGDRLAISEQYSFGNAAATVFVGPSGDPAAGTLQFVLPAGAADVAFSRGLGFDDQYAPAPEVVTAGAGWQDTRPVHPGSGATTLRVTYTLPLAEGVMTLGRTLPYPVRTATLQLADPGLSPTGSSWQPTGSSPDTYSTGSPGASLSLQLESIPEPDRGNWIVLIAVFFLVSGSISLYSWQRRRLMTKRSATTPLSVVDS